MLDGSQTGREGSRHAVGQQGVELTIRLSATLELGKYGGDLAFWLCQPIA